jgi:hypothetical protein
LPIVVLSFQVLVRLGVATGETLSTGFRVSQSTRIPHNGRVWGISSSSNRGFGCESRRIDLNFGHVCNSSGRFVMRVSRQGTGSGKCDAARRTYTLWKNVAITPRQAAQGLSTGTRLDQTSLAKTVVVVNCARSLGFISTTVNIEQFYTLQVTRVVAHERHVCRTLTNALWTSYVAGSLSRLSRP